MGKKDKKMELPLTHMYAKLLSEYYTSRASVFSTSMCEILQWTQTQPWASCKGIIRYLIITIINPEDKTKYHGLVFKIDSSQSVSWMPRSQEIGIKVGVKNPLQYFQEQDMWFTIEVVQPYDIRNFNRKYL